MFSLDLKLLPIFDNDNDLLGRVQIIIKYHII